MRTPKLVVVVPAYNEEKSIKNTIDSIVGQSTIPHALVVVNNASTDSTAKVLEGYSSRYDWIHIINEPIKGTGQARKAGCEYAIANLGADILCCTDADTIVSSGWIESIDAYFEQPGHDNVRMLSGPRRALKDAYYRWYDGLVYDKFWLLMRTLSALRSKDRIWLKLMPGHNLIIRADAYVEAGGFKPTTIAEADEDVDLFIEVYRLYGAHAFGWDKSISVCTSTRRLRKVGYLKLFEYYLAKPDAKRRARLSKGNVDIR